ncbi:proton-conducting transporter membrane subunit, partial [Alcanivorax sp. UBA3183]|uniref:proton-conducting transporter transmembrane domain-containing protein n=3 Tax=Alcanivorax TaxID=59753 RepID=UPI00257B661F
LGTLTMLIGLGTRTALLAAMSYLLAHSLYKGALFMVAGIIDHQTGRKDFLDTGGWARYLPVTSACAGLAALSLAGVMPLFGFIAKEQLLEAGLNHGHALAPLFSAAIVVAATLGVAVAAVIGIRPWFGKPAALTHSPSEAPPAMLLGP